MRDIREMEVGKELNILVAEKVMKQKFRDEWDKLNNATIACYSEDIAAAWKIIEKLCTFTQLTFLTDGWHCGFSTVDSVQADTAPLAICRAALLAVEDKA